MKVVCCLWMCKKKSYEIDDDDVVVVKKKKKVGKKGKREVSGSEKQEQDNEMSSVKGKTKKTNKNQQKSSKRDAAEPGDIYKEEINNSRIVEQQDISSANLIPLKRPRNSIRAPSEESRINTISYSEKVYLNMSEKKILSTFLTKRCHLECTLKYEISHAGEEGSLATMNKFYTPHDSIFEVIDRSVSASIISSYINKSVRRNHILVSQQSPLYACRLGKELVRYL